MNRALLNELQRQWCYPSITVLVNTTPEVPMSSPQIAAAMKLTATADDRLAGDVDDRLRMALITRLTDLVLDTASEPGSRALALCVSPQYATAVRLGTPVEERVVVDDTFATRDLVADLNRTALFRVVTISERSARLLIGDRTRLVERKEDAWPLVRPEGQTIAAWGRYVTTHLRAEHVGDPLPTVVAGVQRSVRRIVTHDLLHTVGFVPGNHDRSSWVELHHLAWPIVSDWLRTGSRRAVQQLESAMSTSRYAGGIHEVWSLANDGRVDTLVVEEGYALPARIGPDHDLLPAIDREHPEVVDDIVDDLIEVVLRQGGNAVIVDDGSLQDHQRIAAVLRY